MVAVLVDFPQVNDVSDDDGSDPIDCAVGASVASSFTRSP